MSVVIAVKDKKNDRIVIGCDSQITSGQYKEKGTGAVKKIFSLENYDIYPIIIGGVGVLRDLQLVQCSENLICKINYYENTLDYKWMVNNLFRNIYKLLVDNGRIEKDDKGQLETHIESTFIIAFQNKAYYMDSDGSVTEIDDYLVMGSGSSVAMGVLENNKDEAPETRICEAIKACAHKTIYVDDNIILTYTKIIPEPKKKGE